MIIVGLLNSIGLLIWELTTLFLWFLMCFVTLSSIGIIIGSLLPAAVALATKDSYWYAAG
jgi:hypothetical protein